MTREDAKKLLGENATDEQVTALLNSVHSEIEAKNTQINDLQTKLNTSTNRVNELSGFEEELKKIKEGQMTKEQLIEQKERELEAKINATNRLQNSIKAKSILVGAGISSERADVLVNKFVKEDEQATLDLANDFVAELNTVKELTAKQVKDDLSKVDITPGGSNVNPKVPVEMTLEKFSEMSVEEQNKFVEEHPDEFANL